MSLFAATTTMYAGFWRRLVATLLDGLFLGVIGATLFGISAIGCSIFTTSVLHKSNVAMNSLLVTKVVSIANVGLIFGLVSPIAGINNLFTALANMTKVTFVPHSETLTLTLALLLIVLINILSWIYYACMESSYHKATLGKLVLKLRVVNQDLQRVSFKQASCRYFMKFLSFGAFCLGYVYIVMNPRKQALHDLLTKCNVIQSSDK
jgi:uncharacterized RDD family membrane protein YckC